MDTSLRDAMERAEVVSQELVEILLRLSASRSPDGSAVEQSLRDAVGELSAFRGAPVQDDAWVEHVRKAHSLVGRSIEAVSDEGLKESLRDAESFLDSLRSSAIDRLVERDPRSFLPGPAVPILDPFLASLGTPAVQQGLTIATPRLFAQSVVIDDPDDDDPENEANDDNETPIVPLRRQHRGKSRGGQPRERMMIEALAREVMEDIGAFSNLRLCFDDEAWANAEPFEKRLLASLDAIMSTSRPMIAGRAELDLAEALYGYATEWSVPDKGRAFAFAFTLANLPQNTALLWVEIGLKGADSRVHAAYVDALSLANSPAIHDRLRSLLGGDVPKNLMIVALQASIRRRFFHAGAMLSLLAHPDPAVAELATLATSHAKTAILVDAISARDSEARASVRAAQGLALILHGESRGQMILRDLAPRALATKDDGALRKILRGLAIWGDQADHEIVFKIAESTKRYRDVGFFGHADHVPMLFAVVEALDLRMMENAEPGTVDLYIGQSNDCASSIKRITKIDIPRFGSSRYDVDSGRAALASWHSQVIGRLRWNAAFDVKTIPTELLDDKTNQGERVVLADELALHTKGECRLDPCGWVTDQRVLLRMVIDAWNR